MRKSGSSLLLACAALFLSAFAACNKLSKATYNPSTSDSVIVKSNVLIVDSSQYKLISTDAQLRSGIYVFSFEPSVTDLRHNGDFAANTTIIGLEGRGFLRKIIGVTSTSSTIICNTILGRLEDVFQQGKINLSTGTSTFREGASAVLNERVYTQHTGTDVRFKTGTVTFSQDWNIGMQFANGVLTSYTADSKSGWVNCSTEVQISNTTPSSLSVADTVWTYSTTSTVMVGGIPVIVTAEACVLANVSGSTTTPGSHSYVINNAATLNYNIAYLGGAWQNTGTATAVTASISGNTAAAPQMNMTCNLVPIVNIRVYNEAISNCIMPVNNSMVANLSTTTNDWDFASLTTLRPRVDENTALISYSASEFSKTWTADSAQAIAPYTLLKVSGDNQNGAAGNYLPKPIVVKVVDNNNFGVPGVTVHFIVNSGGGYLTYNTIASDANGLASASWLFGPGGSGQTVLVWANKADGSNIAGAPVKFTAN